MGIFYIFSLIFLIMGFLVYKKSDEKLNFIKWLIIALASVYSYNIAIGMILGLLNITSHIWLLSLINIAFGIALWYRCLRHLECQKYKISKFDVAGLLIILIIFSVMLVKDLYIHKMDISHFAIDSAIHYRAAKHYSDNLKIFINTEDKTFFNFNVMQTGAYINNGIFMNVIHSITDLDYPYLYQMFETITLFISGLAMYAFFIEKIKTKRGFIASLGLFVLYIYGYPYNSWFYGFSYLSVGIAMSTLLLSVVETIYSDEKICKRISITLTILASFALIFSYCLFVPAIFPAICIYCFLKDISNKETKKYLKFFGKNTLIVTGILLVVTAIGICYLFIPTFFIEGQTDLISALKLSGGMYSEKYANFIVYIPFGVMYFAEIIKRIKNKSLRFQDIFSVCIVGYTALFFIGNRYGFISEYYMLKTYSILWIVIFSATIDLINQYVDEKLFRIDVIILFALNLYLYFKLYFAQIVVTPDNVYGVIVGVFKEVERILKYNLVLLLALFTVLPEIVKHIDLTKIKKLPECLKKKIELKNIRISGYTYTIIWTIFVFSWVWLKAGNILPQETKQKLPNLVGMYYSENCDYRKLVDLTQNFNENEVKLALYAKDNLEDMTADNTRIIVKGIYSRAWSMALTEFSSDKIKYQDIIEDNTVYTVEDTLKDEEKKYLIRLVSKESNDLNEYTEELKNVKNNDNIEILYENENGFVAKIN